MSTPEIYSNILEYNRAESKARRIMLVAGLATTFVSARYLGSSEKFGVKQVAASFALHVGARIATLAALDEYDYLKHGSRIPFLEPFGHIVTETEGETLNDANFDSGTEIIFNRINQEPGQQSGDVGFQGPRGH